MGNAVFITPSVSGTQTSTQIISANPDIEAPSGEDLTLKLGDAAGANKLIVTNSSGTTVFDWTSTGAYTLYD